MNLVNTILSLHAMEHESDPHEQFSPQVQVVIDGVRYDLAQINYEQGSGYVLLVAEP